MIRSRAIGVAVTWAPSLLLALASGHELSYNNAGVSDWILAQALVWLLPARRLRPALVLVGTTLLAVAGWSSDVLGVADLGVLVALHAVAATRSRRDAFIAAGCVEALAVAASFRFAPSGSINDAAVLLTGLVMAALFLGLSQQTRREYLHVVEDNAAQVERERIARDIHDVVAHSVSVMIALSEGAAATPDDAAARDTMRQVAATGRTSLTELRRVLELLKSDGSMPTNAVSIAGLRSMVGNIDRAGLRVDLRIDPQADELPASLQSTVYRIVQEALTNTLKHADHPTRADVRIAAEPDSVTVSVSDNGQARLAVEAGSGAGLRGMRERARLYDGTVEAGPSPDGWSVRARLHHAPLSSRA